MSLSDYKIVLGLFLFLIVIGVVFFPAYLLHGFIFILGTATLSYVTYTYLLYYTNNRSWTNKFMIPVVLLISLNFAFIFLFPTVNNFYIFLAIFGLLLFLWVVLSVKAAWAPRYQRKKLMQKTSETLTESFGGWIKSVQFTSNELNAEFNERSIFSSMCITWYTNLEHIEYGLQVPLIDQSTLLEVYYRLPLPKLNDGGNPKKTRQEEYLAIKRSDIFREAEKSITSLAPGVKMDGFDLIYDVKNKIDISDTIKKQVEKERVECLIVTDKKITLKLLGLKGDLRGPIEIFRELEQIISPLFHTS